MDVLKTAKASHEVSVVFWLPGKKYVVEVFLRPTLRLKTTVSYNTLLFFEMNQFFYRLERKLEHRRGSV